MRALATRLLASTWAPWLFLAVMLALHVVVTELGADPFKMVDLDVYVQGARHLTDGTLYDFVTQPLDLPFTYPPFSALLFAPLAWLPWTVTRVVWELGMIAALAAIVHLTLRLLGRVGPGATRPIAHERGIVLVVTGLSLWMEPVRTTFNYGQINLFLAALLLWGAVSSKQWWAGTTVGLAAGVKLIPAITGLYYLVRRQYVAVVAAVLAFAATIAIMLVVIPHETWRYFTKLILDPGRTGPVWSAINQSLRGALARLAGHDVSVSWLLACVVAVVLGGWALWACHRQGDRTAAFLAVQITGLLVSPISWSHHWIWVLPLLIWTFAGRDAGRPAVRILAVAWILATCSFTVSLLIAAQHKGPASRPGWQAWLGTIYPMLGLITLILLATVVGRRRQVSAGPAVQLSSTRESGAPG